MNRAFINTTVRVILEDLTNIPRDRIQDGNDLVRDLRLDGDDFSYEFVPRLEKHFGVVTTQADWDGVRTVADAIELIAQRAQVPENHLEQR